MSTYNTPNDREPDEIYILIVVDERHGRLILHESYGNPANRLEACAELLIGTGRVGPWSGPGLQARIGPYAVQRITDAIRSGRAENADQTLNTIAKECRGQDIGIFATTRSRCPASAPTPHPRLFSVHTTYGPGNIVSEHFTSAEGRRDSLIERADLALAAPNAIPPYVLGDEQRLVDLINAFLRPTMVSLGEAVWDAASNAYRSPATDECLSAVTRDQNPGTAWT